MDRRALLRWIALVSGCALIGDEALAIRPDEAAPIPYSAPEIAFFDEVAETILPRTETPGARDAGVGPFMARYAASCYPPEHIALLRRGLADLDAQMQALNGHSFQQAAATDRTTLLTRIDREAKAHALAAGKAPGAAPHYFTLMKQLTLLGFFTSEAGETRVARYQPIPGRYQGCIPYHGENFWAW